MKIRIELTDDDEQEVVIRTKELNNTVKRIEHAIREITSMQNTFALFKDDTQYYLGLTDILFFETTDGGVCAHTAKDVYETKYKLYELEEILSASFMRVSKSTVLNTGKVYSITRNLTASSLVRFANTHKTVYVSRNYYKALIEKLEEKRL